MSARRNSKASPIFGRCWDGALERQPAPAVAAGVETTSLNAPGRNLVINATMTLSPKVVNEVEFVDSYGAINSVLTNAIADSSAFTSKLTNLTKLYLYSQQLTTLPPQSALA